MRKDGGPALPDEEYEGMSLRDYFAAHAPREIPEWFIGPGLNEISRLPQSFREQWPDSTYPATPQAIRSAVDLWLTDDAGSDLESFLCEDAPAEHFELARKFQAALDEYYVDRDRAREMMDLLRYFAWHWYYADMMLSARIWQIKED